MGKNISEPFIVHLEIFIGHIRIRGEKVCGSGVSVIGWSCDCRPRASQGLDAFEEFGRAPLDDGAGGLFVVLNGGQVGDGGLDAFEFGQGGSLVVEDAVHVPDQLVDAKVDYCQVVQEPVFSHYCLLQFQQSRVHFLRPLHLLEPPQLLRRLLLAVDGDHVAHVLDGPDVHLDHALVPERAAEEVGRAEAVDDIDAHGDGLGDDEGAFAEVGQAGKGPIPCLFGVESLPLGQRKQLVLVIHSQVLAQQTAHLRLPPKVVVPNHDALFVLASLALRG